MEQSLVYLKQANTHACLESDLKQDILHQASLEIRKPLKMLMENVDALLGDTEHKLNRKQSTTLNDIQEEAEILMDITDSMLTSRRDEAVSGLVQTDLNEVVRNVINLFRPVAQMGRIMINLELPPQPAMIKVYPTQITKVIEGLLSNALKYSPTNGEISIRIDQNEHDTVLTVKDQGNGIDDSLAARIFEINSSVFGQSARRFGGIGISLATVKKIISAYKGQIWIENILGTGFTISFSLPRA